MKPRSRRRPALAPVLLCLAALLAFLPWILSAPGLHNLVLSSIGNRFSGNLSADSCSFGWFSGLRCQNLRYQSQQGFVTLESQEAGNNRGLLSLLLAPGTLGDIEVSNPLLTLRPERLRTPDSGKAGGKSRLVRWWNSKSLQLRVRHGQVQVEQGGRVFPLFEQAGMDAGLENGSLRYTLKASANKSRDYDLHAEGFVNAPPEGGKVQTLLTTNTLTLKEIPVSSLPPLPFAPDLFLESGGTATGSWRLMSDVDGVFLAEGSLFLRDLLLPALSAGEQRIPLAEASLHFKGRELEDQQWRVEQLNLDSPLLTLHLRGSRLKGKTEVAASAKLDLPLISEGLRLRLGLRPDARVTSGGLQCSAAAAGRPESLPVRLDCLLTEIQGSRGSQSFVWKAPLNLIVEVLFANAGPQWRKAQGSGSYASFQVERGQGGTFSLQADADLSAISRDLGQLVQIPLIAGGAMTLAVNSISGAGGGNQDELRLTIRDFSLENGKDHSVLLSAHPFSLKASGTHKPGTGRGTGQMALESWPCTLKLDAQELGRDGKTGGYTLKGEVQLARIQPVLGLFFPALQAVQASGIMDLNLEAKIRDGRHEIRTGQATVRWPDFKIGKGASASTFAAAHLNLAVGEAALAPAAKTPGSGKKGRKGRTPSPSSQPASPALTLDNALTALLAKAGDQAWFSPGERSLLLQPFLLQSERAQARLKGGLALQSRGRRNTATALVLNGSLDGSILDFLLRAAGRMPSGVHLGGTSQLAFSFSKSGVAPSEAECAARISQLGFGRETRFLARQQDFTVHARFKEAIGEALPASWELPEFKAQSKNFWAQGKGFLWDEGKDACLLALQGQYRTSGEPLPFRISLPLH